MREGVRLMVKRDKEGKSRNKGVRNGQVENSIRRQE